jgi:hypothetical protein
MKALAPLLTLGMVAIAAQADATAVWTASAKVTGIYTGYGQQRVEIVGLQNVAACTNANVAFEQSWADTPKILSIGTAALLSGRKVACYVDGCVGGFQKGLICLLQ